MQMFKVEDGYRELLVHGAATLSTRQREHGVLEAHTINEIPFGYFLKGLTLFPRYRTFSRLLHNGNTIQLQEGTGTFLLPATTEALAWGLELLQSIEYPGEAYSYLAAQGKSEARGFEELRHAYKHIFKAGSIRGFDDWFALPSEQQKDTIVALAELRSVGDREEKSKEDHLLRWLERSSCFLSLGALEHHFPNPTYDEVEPGRRVYMQATSQDAPVSAVFRGEEKTDRYAISQQEEGWLAAKLQAQLRPKNRGRGPRATLRFAPEHLQGPLSEQELYRWIEKHAPQITLEFVSGEKSGFTDESTAWAFPRLRPFKPSLAHFAACGVEGSSHGGRYFTKTRKALGERAKELEVSKRSALGSEELRQAIGEYAGRASQVTALGEGQGFFLEELQTAISYEKGTIPEGALTDNSDFEALICAALGETLVHPAFAPQPGRLKATHPWLNAYTPLNPYQ